jgi:tetratricopeptide (TPR) repeat protein
MRRIENLGGELSAVASQCAVDFEGWFGEGPDPRWPTVFYEASFAGCSRNRLLRAYVVILAANPPHAGQRASEIAHELYHRATFGRPGMRREHWVDEMLAVRSAVHALRGTAFAAYADYLHGAIAQGSSAEFDSGYRDARPQRVLFGFRGTRFHRTFAPAVAALGVALEMVVGWPKLRALGFCPTCEAWTGSMDPRTRWLAHVTVGIEPYARPAPLPAGAGLTSKDWRDLAHCLLLTGRPALALDAVQAVPATDRGAWDCGTLEALAMTAMGDHRAAVQKYRDVAQSAAGDLVALGNLGAACLAAGMPADGLEAFRAALAIVPASSADRLGAGICLEMLGRLAEARTEFEAARASGDLPYAVTAEAHLKRLSVL